MILGLSTASLRSVCSSKHEAGQRSLWFEIRISLGLYKLFLLVRFNRKSPRSSESCNKAWKRELIPSGARCANGIDAFKALASELGMSVEGIRWKEEFASRVNVQRSKCKNLLHGCAVSCKAVAQRFFGRSSRRWRLEIFVPLRKSVSSYLSYYISIFYIYMQVSNNQHGYISTGYHQSSVPWFQTSFSIRGSKGLSLHDIVSYLSWMVKTTSFNFQPRIFPFPSIDSYHSWLQAMRNCSACAVHVRASIFPETHHLMGFKGA